MMKFGLKWEKGRQDAEYSKAKLWSFWRTDGYFLHFPRGTKIPWHFDKVDGRHFRFNFTLGGLWILKLKNGMVAQSFLDGHLFRPDIEEHSAEFFDDTVVFSVGFRIK